MRVSPQELELIRSKGIEPIGTDRAIEVLARCMAIQGGHYLCANGDARLYAGFLVSGYSKQTLPVSE
jgi:hypothetical protein